ncbi:unnamed protein product [Trichogramma brassicae]|uniref:Uncharacterized protein n=1 Tax=Trichogramma brassicae TaxID=86971 RepID=A0A6H5IBF2_9HYME|nr:unnamed protein product [Trichogramma brassicae]
MTRLQGMSTSSMTNVRASLASTLLGLKKAGSTSSLTVPASPQHQIQQQQQQHQQIGQQTHQHLLANTRSLPPSPSASRKVLGLKNDTMMPDTATTTSSSSTTTTTSSSATTTITTSKLVWMRKLPRS